MARTRGGLKQFTSKTRVLAQDHVAEQDHFVAQDHVGEPESTRQVKRVPPSNDSFLTHTSLKHKGQIQRNLHPPSSPSSITTSPTSSSAVLEEVRGSLLGLTSAREEELGRSFQNASSKFSSPYSTPKTNAVNNGEFGGTPTSPFLFLSPSPMGSKSSLPSLPSTPTALGKDALLDTDEDKNEFYPTSSTSLSSHVLSLIRKPQLAISSGELKCAGSRPRESDFIDETIQEANNNAEANIVISDDEEEVPTQITAETDRNCTDYMSSPTAREVSISDSNVISFKFNKDQDHSASAVYKTPPKAINVSYKDSVTGENAPVSDPFPRAIMNNDNQMDTTVIISDDDESTTSWKPGSAKKKFVPKRLFSDFPLRQNQIENGKKPREDMLQDGLNKHSEEANTTLNMLSRLGPGITITKAASDNSIKPSSDSINDKAKEAIDKIRRLGPAISFRRANE